MIWYNNNNLLWAYQQQAKPTRNVCEGESVSMCTTPELTIAALSAVNAITTLQVATRHGEAMVLCTIFIYWQANLSCSWSIHILAGQPVVQLEYSYIGRPTCRAVGVFIYWRANLSCSWTIHILAGQSLSSKVIITSLTFWLTISTLKYNVSHAHLHY